MSDWLWRTCLAGLEPAESLATIEREQLVMLLAERGWTVDEIAEHTRMTAYTTDRILTRMLRRRADLAVLELVQRANELAAAVAS